MNEQNNKSEFDLEEERFQQFLRERYSNLSTVEKEPEEPETVAEVASEAPTTAEDSDKEIKVLRDLFPDMSPLKAVKNKSLVTRIKTFFKTVTEQENIKRIFSLAVPGLLVLLLLFNIVMPSKDVSEKENRALAQFPVTNGSTIVSGQFMKDFESYISDQFVFRNHFVASKRRYETLSGKEENRNILFGKDGYLIENSSAHSEVNLNSNMQAINALAQVDRYNVKVAIVPTAYEIHRDKLPRFAYTNAYEKLQNRLQKGLQKGIAIADTAPALKKHSDEYLYYRSDHHQTALGSFYTYTALAKTLGFEPYPITDFTVEEMATDFCGTCYSTSGFARTENDTIYKYSLAIPPKYKVSFPLDKQEMDSLYNEKMLKGRDKYAFYLDGNHAITQIKSDAVENRRLAIIKDSYAHSIVPFLANHYSDIYMIDLRYYNEDVFKYLYDNNIKDVLILYNHNTFMTDNNLAKISEFKKTSVFAGSVPDVSYGVVPELKKVDASYFDDAVFVGDSLTIGIQNFSGFNSEFLCMGGLNTKNLDSAVLPSGKTTLQSIFAREQMGKIYIMLGTNEIAYDEMESYLERYSAFIDKIREKFPNTIVYIESIMPVTKHYSESTSIKNDKIPLYNEQLLKMAKEKQCYYVDVHSYYKGDDGYLPDNIGSDGVHLGPEKYREFAEYLQKHAVPEKGVVKLKDGKNKTFAGGKADTDGIAKKILKKAKPKDTLAKVSDSIVISSYKIDPKKIASASMYLGGGATAEEIAVFELKDKKYAKQLEKLIQERIERRKLDFKNYIPEEMPKLNSPVIEQKGKVIAVCIADNITGKDVLSCMK